MKKKEQKKNIWKVESMKEKVNWKKKRCGGGVKKEGGIKNAFLHY